MKFSNEKIKRIDYYSQISFQINSTGLIVENLEMLIKPHSKQNSSTFHIQQKNIKLLLNANNHNDSN